MGTNNDKPTNYLLLNHDCTPASRNLAERIVNGAVMGKAIPASSCPG